MVGAALVRGGVAGGGGGARRCGAGSAGGPSRAADGWRGDGIAFVDRLRVHRLRAHDAERGARRCWWRRGWRASLSGAPAWLVVYSLLVAAGGTLFEARWSTLGFFYYSSPDFIGVPRWLPGIYLHVAFSPAGDGAALIGRGERGASVTRVARRARRRRRARRPARARSRPASSARLSSGSTQRRKPSLRASASRSSTRPDGAHLAGQPDLAEAERVRVDGAAARRRGHRRDQRRDRRPARRAARRRRR